MHNNTELRIKAHLVILSSEIGSRPGGSAANNLAIEYIQESLQKNGWNVETQSFPCPEWINENTILSINNQPLPAVANAYSPPCAVTGRGIAVGTLAELTNADFTGNIGILYGDLTQAPLSPKSWFLKSDRDDLIIRLLEEKQPLALITVQGNKEFPECLIEDWEFMIPSVTVGREEGLRILNLDRPFVSIQIKSKIKNGSTANVVARSAPARNRVVICAHHDTKFNTPGALDNGSGEAVLLTIAETIDPQKYPFQLELVSFANEEYLPIGDDEYLKRQDGQLNDIIAAINIDGAGLTIAPDTIADFSCSKEFALSLRKMTEAYPELVWTDPWPESNHSTFAFRGVPSIAFTSTIRTFLAHHPDDTVRWMNPKRLKRVVMAIESILDILAEHPPEWSREPESP